MSRAQFALGAVATALSIPAVASPAHAAATYEYKHGHHLPATSPLHLRYVQMWDAVRRESGGQLNVTVFPSNQLGSSPELFTQVRTGALQFMTASGGTLSSVIPAAGIEETGFAFTSSALGFAAMDGPLGAYIRKEIEAKGLIAGERIWSDGFEVLTSTNKPIRTPDDMHGLKLRSPIGGMWVDLFRALGAAPTSVDLSEMYTSLQTHIVDAQSCPFLDVELTKVYEIQKYLSFTNHIFVGFWLVGNADAIKALPPNLQAIVSRNNTKYALLERGDVAGLAAMSLKSLQQKGMQSNTVSAAEFRAALRPYYAKLKTQFGETAWGMLESSVGNIA
jgi:tripartite ATP-independent transporter DctP family solute receptor